MAAYREGIALRPAWDEGRWRVLFKRPRGVNRDANGDGDLVFRKGQFIPVSFANWDGNNTEVGSKHTQTPWFWLLLPHETNYSMVYGAPAGTSLGFLCAGALLIWRMRRNNSDINASSDTDAP